MRHGPFKGKVNAKRYAKERRKNGCIASLYQRASGTWWVSVTRRRG